MVISKPDATGRPNRIIINDWSSGDLSINLTGTAPAAPEITLSGDIKKAIDDRGTPDTSDDVFKITDGNYERDTISGDGNQAGALDLINGTAGNDVMDGKGGDDAMVGKDGNDYLIGGIGGDYILGGLGKDTVKGITEADLLDDSQTIHILNGFEMPKKNQQYTKQLQTANTNEWRLAA